MNNLFELKKNRKESVQDFVSNKFREYRERMQDRYRSWLLNLAWVRGFQNTDYSRTEKRFQKVDDKEPWRVRLVSNLMLPQARRILSQLTYIKPVWDVIPATSDEEDIQIAEKSTKVLQDTWQRVGLNKKLIRLLTWQSVCANAFFKVGWDFDLGDEISYSTKELENDTVAKYLEFLGLEVAPDIITEQQGDIYLDVVSPFNITVDESVSVFEDADWVIETQLRTKDFIVSKYGNKFKNLKETEDFDLFVYPYVQNYMEVGSRMPRKGVLVHEFFVRKISKMFPKGLHAVIASDQFIIPPQDNPFDHGELPYSHFVEIYDAASFSGTCITEQIRPNQARYNRLNSSIMENANLMSNLQWMKPKSAGHITFTNRPGGVIEYTGNIPPAPIQPPSMPAFVERFSDRTRSDMQDTASSHDVSEAKNEPGVRSGRGILALQDADDSILTPVLIWMDESLARAGRLALQTIIQFTDGKRHAEIEGEYNEHEIFSYTGVDLVGKSKQGNYWKVRVKTFGRQALSRSGREQIVRTLIELQLLHPAIDKELILHLLGTADLISIYDKNSMDRTRQWKEIKTLVEGGRVQVYPGQNHVVHLENIKKFISSAHWDRLNEQQKQTVIQHWAMHNQQMVAEQLYPQIQAAQFAQSTMGVENAGRR